MAKYKQADMDQYQWMMLNLGNLFTPDHPTSALLQLIQGLNLTPFHEQYKNDHQGSTAIPPDRVLAVLFWYRLYGGDSMRRLEADLSKRADLLYLSGGLEMDHSFFSRFRKRHAAAIEVLFKQTVFFGTITNQIRWEDVYFDSTKVKACASNSSIFTEEQLDRVMERVEEFCDRVRKELESEDAEDTVNAADHAVRERRLLTWEKRLGALRQGKQYLASHPERKRVHLYEPDADLQKDPQRGFITGYSAHVGVDSHSQLIVHKEVTPEQNDCGMTIPMVTAMEEQKASVSESVSGALPESTKYGADAGYASEANLAALQDKDLYIPDRGLAQEASANRLEQCGTPAKKAEEPVEPAIVFTYDAQTDSFDCPSGNRLRFYRRYDIFGNPYLQYRATGCRNCPHHARCCRKQPNCRLQIREDERGKVLTVERGIRKRRQKGIPQGLHTRAMREKLKSSEGKAVYGKRLWVVEGVFAILTYHRRGWQFFRRGLSRVETEFTEQCIAYNLGKLIGFKLHEGNPRRSRG